MYQEFLREIDARLFDLASHGDIEGVKKALSEGADPMTSDRNGWTALMVAACYHDISLMRLLLPISDPNHQNKNKRTTLMLVAEGCSNLEKVALLLPATDLTLKDEDGLDARDLAVNTWRIDTVELIDIFAKVQSESSEFDLCANPGRGDHKRRGRL